MPTVSPSLRTRPVKLFNEINIEMVEQGSDAWMHCINFLQDAWEMPQRTPHFYPGPQPISIERKHFERLRDNEYLVCEKSDGVRFGFISTKFNGNAMTVIVNRKLDMFVVKTKFSLSITKGTVADLELIRCGEAWMALIYDVAWYGGVDIKNSNLYARLAYANKIQKAVRKNKYGDDITFRGKPMFPKDQIERALHGESTHISDGLIFTPVNEPLRIGTHETMFKYKEKSKCTVDFLCRPFVDTIRLFVQERGKLLYETEIPVNMIFTKYREKIREDTIVECQYNEKTKLWHPIGIREDKTHPNNRRTFLRTMTNIAENIKPQEFVTLLKTAT